MRPASAGPSAALSLAIRGSSQASRPASWRNASKARGSPSLCGTASISWSISDHRAGMPFGMNGSLRHFEDGEDDPPSDRLRLDFADEHHLAYVNPRLLGRVRLAREAAEFFAATRVAP